MNETRASAERKARLEKQRPPETIRRRRKINKQASHINKRARSAVHTRTGTGQMIRSLATVSPGEGERRALSPQKGGAIV